MPSTASPATPSRGLWSKPLVWIAWILILSGLAYFVGKNIPRYFVFTPESYGDYFWPKKGFLFPHIIGGLVAAILGPLQFVPRIRRDYIGFHRIAGRLYVVMVFVGSIASFGMSLQIGGDDSAFLLGLAGLAVAWLVTTGMAFVAIRRKNIAQHKQWMIRSYVVTFGFVTFRLLANLLDATKLMPSHEIDATLAWACWAVPLLFTEMVLQSREALRKRA